jgi:malic enzyme
LSVRRRRLTQLVVAGLGAPVAAAVIAAGAPVDIDLRDGAFTMVGIGAGIAVVRRLIRRWSRRELVTAGVNVTEKAGRRRA